MTSLLCRMQSEEFCFKSPHIEEVKMPKRILFVLTSHDRKGQAESKDAAPSGFYPVNASFWNNDSLREATKTTLKPSQIDPDVYDAVYYAGGHATMWDLPDNIELAGVSSRIYEKGGVVAAVCHGPAGLVNIRLSDNEYLVAGKKVSAFTNDEERAVGLYDIVPFLLEDTLKQRGAEHLAAANFQPQVIVSERLVTGQNPASAKGVAEAMLPLLASIENRRA